MSEELDIKKKKLIEEIKKNCEERLAESEDLEKEIENYNTKLLGILEKSPSLSVQLLEKRLIDGIEANKIPVCHSKNKDVTILSVGESAEAGMNAPKKVTFEDKDGVKKSGFKKNNVIPYFNDSAFAMEQIGNLLNLKMARNYEYNVPGEPVAIISENIADSDKGEEFVSMNKYMKGTESLEKAKEYFKENKDTIARGDIPEFYAKRGRVMSPEAIEVLLELPLNALKEKTENIDEIDAFEDEYIKMLCFDFVTNQTDRHDKNYGVVLTHGENGTQVAFAPIFDSDYILHDESYPDKNDIAFNMAEKVDRKELIQVIASKYPEKVKAFGANLKECESQIYNIIQSNFSDKKIDGIFTGEKTGNPMSIIDVYMDSVKENIKDFQEIVRQIENKSMDTNDRKKQEEKISEDFKLTISKENIQEIAKMESVVLRKEDARKACEKHIAKDILRKDTMEKE